MMKNKCFKLTFCIFNIKNHFSMFILIIRKTHYFWEGSNQLL